MWLSSYRRAQHGLTHVCVCVAVLLTSFAPEETGRPAPTQAARPATAAEVDAALRRASASALGSREGTIIVMDAQTGRLRAVAGRDSRGAFPPGSAIKPFTLLAALRASLLDADTRQLCRKHYRRGRVEFSCSHPVFKPRFGPTEALAHSCNYFFAHLSERVRAEDFAATLRAYGFGQAPADSRREAATREAGGAARPVSARRAANTPRQTRHAEPLEMAPHVAVADWHTETGLGEGCGVLTTTTQLAAAYAALANGGRLFEPTEAAAEGYEPHERGRVSVTGAERALLLTGMRGAVRYGTAEHARLDRLPLRVYGKTGTATEIGGFRTHGWFVGLAADAPADGQAATGADDGALPSPGSVREADGTGEDSSGADSRPSPAGTDELTVSSPTPPHAQPAPSEFRLAVVVFLRRAQGKQAAELARPVLAEFARLTSDRADAPPGGEATADVDDRSAARGGEPRAGGRAVSSDDAQTVRVRLARDGAVRVMPLGEYLFGVLAAEASTEDEFAALKAQAVVSRTYALSKLSRHDRDGFDFCTSTHCQRYLRVTAADSRPDFHALVRRAVAETAGEVLRDSRGRAADAYFSANCGGMTADVGALWGTPAREPYERGVRDQHCVAARDTHWRDVVPARRLAEALRDDPRSDVGARLDGVSVVKRDASGRAELVELRGETRRTLRGWDFKIIVGRSLGWATIKSSRFTVERAGAAFVFRGTGFGHGLGLCQAGAHAMARGGASYRQILAHYFPGATAGRLSATTTPRDRSVWHADASVPLAVTPQRYATGQRGAAPGTRRDAGARLTLSSENFRVTFPAGRDASARRDAEAVLATLEAARADMRRRLEAASLPAPALPVFEVNANATTADFVAATGQPSWVAAATRGRRVELQPLATLRRRRVLTETLRHEYAHAVVEALSRGRAPHWLAEGLAAHFAGEGPLLAPHAPPEKMSLDELEGRLCQPNPAAETRSLYAAAHREVLALIRSEGEPAVWRRVTGG